LRGGCLINGGRGGPPEDIRELCTTEDHALVSLDYRLGPEVQVPEINEDVRNAFGWIREEGPDLFGTDRNRVAVTGGSAGGYLTMMTGPRAEMRPRARRRETADKRRIVPTSRRA
jgi:acetyl esterase/lipase